MGRVRRGRLERRGLEEEMLKIEGREKRVDDDDSAIAKDFKLEVTNEEVISGFTEITAEEEEEEEERVCESDKENQTKREPERVGLGHLRQKCSIKLID